MEHYLSLGVTTAGWKIEPQKTRGKAANRAARVFIVDFLSVRIARRAFQHTIPLLQNSIVLQFIFAVFRFHIASFYV